MGHPLLEVAPAGVDKREGRGGQRGGNDRAAGGVETMSVRPLFFVTGNVKFFPESSPPDSSRSKAALFPHSL